MKVRNGFVSNSSSSSYIIKINREAECCSKCGKKESFLDYLKIRSNFYGDSGIEYSSKSNILNEIGLQIDHTIKNIINALDINPQDRPVNLVPRERELLKHLTDRFYKLSEIEEELYGISISYHDDDLQNAFDKAINDGEITIVEDNN